MCAYAHILKSDDSGYDCQKLEDHLKNSADTAGRFAERFNAYDWGYLAGLWHDLGKYSDRFQEKLDRAMNGGPDIRVDHSTYGAGFVNSKEKLGKFLAYAIAGHHSGLPDATGNDSSLRSRLQKDLPHVDVQKIPPEILSHPELKPDTLKKWFADLSDRRRAFAEAFFIRMIYSCLVDADYLDTERFMNPEKSSRRDGFRPLAELRDEFVRKMDGFRLRKNADGKEINSIRNGIYEECVEASGKEPGIFSLTVPTGGGKTLSSLAFALEHAVKYGLDRIIYVIPYTSIIEQNAKVFRDFLGDGAVLEHHSNYVKGNDDDREKLAALASENWDAPVVVTTNVQFFESLFANRSTRARKIHNISKSVVILDEAQMIPVDYLYPSIEVLRELSSHYGTTIVLCTATQPALGSREKFSGLENVREIISDPKGLSGKLKRVRERYVGELDDDSLAEKISGEDRVLCIVNSRRDAAGLYKKVDEMSDDPDGNYHLSALMCPEHRSRVLDGIKERLKTGKTCRVISTQLVEAGVDVDFPVVYRSLAGIDSIAQAAGRCNREGTLDHGDLYVFKPSKGIPAIADFRPRAEEAKSIIEKNEDSFLSIESVREFFEAYYWRKGDSLDKKEILRDFREGLPKIDFPFRTVSEKFSIIDDSQLSIFIPYDRNSADLINTLKYRISVSILRKLQRYAVQVPEMVVKELQSAGYIEAFGDEFFTVTDVGMKEVYSEKTGLTLDTPEFYQAENTIL